MTLSNQNPVVDAFRESLTPHGFSIHAIDHPDGTSFKARLECEDFAKVILLCDSQNSFFIRAGVEIPLLDSVFTKLFRRLEVQHTVLHSVSKSEVRRLNENDSIFLLRNDCEDAVRSLLQIGKPGDIAPWLTLRCHRKAVGTNWHQARLYWIALTYLAYGASRARSAIQEELNPPDVLSARWCVNRFLDLVFARSSLQKESRMFEASLKLLPNLESSLPTYDANKFRFEKQVIQRL